MLFGLFGIFRGSTAKASKAMLSCLLGLVLGLPFGAMGLPKAWWFNPPLGLWVSELGCYILLREALGEEVPSQEALHEKVSCPDAFCEKVLQEMQDLRSGDSWQVLVVHS